MPIRNQNQLNDLPQFPADSWVRFTLTDREYVGRALRLERANIVATIDSGGKSVTFSWPFICANVVGRVQIL